MKITVEEHLDLYSASVINDCIKELIEYGVKVELFVDSRFQVGESVEIQKGNISELEYSQLEQEEE